MYQIQRDIILDNRKSCTNMVIFEAPSLVHVTTLTHPTVHVTTYTRPLLNLSTKPTLPSMYWTDLTQAKWFGIYACNTQHTKQTIPHMFSEKP